MKAMSRRVVPSTGHLKYYDGRGRVCYSKDGKIDTASDLSFASITDYEEWVRIGAVQDTYPCRVFRITMGANTTAKEVEVSFFVRVCLTFHLRTGDVVTKLFEFAVIPFPMSELLLGDDFLGALGLQDYLEAEVVNRLLAQVDPLVPPATVGSWASLDTGLKVPESPCAPQWDGNIPDCVSGQHVARRAAPAGPQVLVNHWPQPVPQGPRPPARTCNIGGAEWRSPPACRRRTSATDGRSHRFSLAPSRLSMQLSCAGTDITATGGLPGG